MIISWPVGGRNVSQTASDPYIFQPMFVPEGSGAANVNFSLAFPNITSLITLAEISKINLSTTFPNIRLAMTLGNGATDTHDGGLPRHFTKDYLRKLKEQEAILAAREAEKLAEKRLLRQQIEDLINPPVETEQEVELQADNLSIIPIIPIIPDQLPDLTVDLEKIENELKVLGEQIIAMQREAMIESNRLREEDDIEAIMMALNAPFEVFKKTIH